MTHIEVFTVRYVPGMRAPYECYIHATGELFAGTSMPNLMREIALRVSRGELDKDGEVKDSYPIDRR